MKKITLLSTIVLASVVLSACCNCKNCKITPKKPSTPVIQPVLVDASPSTTQIPDDAVVEESTESSWLSPDLAKWGLAASLIGVGVGIHFLLRNKKK